MSAEYYCLWFFVIYLYQALGIFIMKSQVSTDFKKANLFDQMLHTAESCNFAFAMNDWDFETNEPNEPNEPDEPNGPNEPNGLNGPIGPNEPNGPNEHYERMETVRTEIILNILVNLTANLILLTPLPYLCK